MWRHLTLRQRIVVCPLICLLSVYNARTWLKRAFTNAASPSVFPIVCCAFSLIQGFHHHRHTLQIQSGLWYIHTQSLTPLYPANDGEMLMLGIGYLVCCKGERRRKTFKSALSAPWICALLWFAVLGMKHSGCQWISGNRGTGWIHTPY